MALPFIFWISGSSHIPSSAQAPVTIRSNADSVQRIFFIIICFNVVLIISMPVQNRVGSSSRGWKLMRW